jgi:hypothetical protein
VQRIEVPGKWGADAADAAAFLLDSGPVRHLLNQVSPPSRTRHAGALATALQRYEANGAV